MTTLTIELPAYTYPIFIEENCIDNSVLLGEYIHGKQVLIVTNNTVAELYLKKIMAPLHAFQCDTLILPDGEEYKNQDSLFKIYDTLIKQNHHRDTTLIALGGGVVGDITGFAASTYQRGVPYIQVPTTLLAQVDSSVGGKTAINHPLGKNMIGSFYHPQAVFIDITTLDTLPERELRAGFAEVIKYGLLAGGTLLKRIQEVLIHNIPIKNFPYLEIITQCCEIKGRIVEKDEKEKNVRALLNLGHTFAHALESYTGYKRWLHGEAVGIGLYCAALLSYREGVLSKENLTLVDNLLLKANLPRRIPKDINLDHLFTWFYKDKKIKENKLRVVLIRRPGSCFLNNTISDESLRSVLMDTVEGD